VLFYWLPGHLGGLAELNFEVGEEGAHRGELEVHGGWGARFLDGKSAQQLPGHLLAGRQFQGSKVPGGSLRLRGPLSLRLGLNSGNTTRDSDSDEDVIQGNIGLRGRLVVDNDGCQVGLALPRNRDLHQ